MLYSCDVFVVHTFGAFTAALGSSKYPKTAQSLCRHCMLAELHALSCNVIVLHTFGVLTAALGSSKYPEDL